ncbi:cupin domain-containing protein [Pedobacter africanus]|uniref:Cupin domain-containing protein n=1 Tax=Pedobacter africanus TaxID=151894 RepID=A0A1W1Z8G5_9SPHI|nr:cupin domain-containing protein [Pedobacter africanus]SMC44441.1 Cupin domain-containing protein [Pedobacter africanus]
MKLLPIDINQVSQAATGDYTNLALSVVNDQVIRMSVMTRPYYWHYHPNSDESFLGLEGILIIELENQTIELYPGQLITIPKGMPHKTRPKNQRSVNLTFEHQHMETSIIGE